MSDEEKEKMSVEDTNVKSLQRADSQSSRKLKSRNQLSGAFFMDKEGFANRLSQISSPGSVDSCDSAVKKENKIEKLDLSQITEDDAKESTAQETSVTEEDAVNDEKRCTENADANRSRKLVDTCSTDSIKATSEVVFPEETTITKQLVDGDDGTNDAGIIQKSDSIGGNGKSVPEATDDGPRSRNSSTASVSDADSAIMDLKANTHTDTRPLIRRTRERAKSDAKEIIQKQKEKRSYSYSKKAMPPIGKGKYASNTISQPSKSNEDISWAKGFWSRCPCDAIKRDPKLKTKVCTIT